MPLNRPRTLLALMAGTGLLLVGTGPSLARTSEPEPGSPAYVQRDTQNIADAYGRIHGEGGQLRNPAYLPALVAQGTATSVAQLLTQVAEPTRPALTAGNSVPGWDVGNPLRASWAGTRGRARRVAFTNQHGALLRGTVWAPAPGARDPYSGRRLRGPFPGVVITPGSVQGSEGMYEWLAQDLAERGYVVLTYDVQGQGASETFPHPDGQVFPFCDPTAEPLPGEMSGCPGVPFQQQANFEVGTRDALSFLHATPARPYANPGSEGARVDAANPFHRLLDRSRDHSPFTPGRRQRTAIIGHSLGAAAVSRVQAVDERVATVVALDKLGSPLSSGPQFRPVVPALGIQSEYGFSVSPWFLSGGSSISPQPSPGGPDPQREKATGWDAWDAAGIDSMMLVPRASTHLEYTDIPLVLPASRWGQAVTSVTVQRWLDRYLKHRGGPRALLRERMRYLEPTGGGTWSEVRLRRDPLLSSYYCSAYRLDAARRTLRDADLTGVGC
ncbi:Alpha/beta hydrolase family protein [Nocardioides dokdonensis FR1436]|uniref:Alpha/beta hydrolase family protein n=1 Tax=Nocardioides dokdonensis FR1436 TaxID=1300347 RepID=A0A1A9GQL5_9ACTN|nr:alpha/beta hydrolase [Nocardioides dokdonensis]ANH39751.1 Alpha/beta hydrolase family protein [Nocardioides dokdonensis FR1436]